MEPIALLGEPTVTLTFFAISEKELLLPPVNEVCEGYVFTRVCLSTGGKGVPGQVSPGTRYTPQDQVHPQGPGTPPWDQVLPPGRGTPPWEQCILGDTGNKWAVCIIQECILVTTCKRSFGQGNVFTDVCLSTRWWRGCYDVTSCFGHPLLDSTTCVDSTNLPDSTTPRAAPPPPRTAELFQNLCTL